MTRPRRADHAAHRMLLAMLAAHLLTLLALYVMRTLGGTP